MGFDDQAEEAARYYVSILTVGFILEGQTLTALNGGPEFPITEAVSFIVRCATQEEVDHSWERLSEGGPFEAQMCGWLKDRRGVSGGGPPA
jgi:predicted 3-demethylubiquinone-9 3-methyltransferase (glyoxalase superfamily)